MLNKATTLKRKLEALQQEETALHQHQKARLKHMQDLHEIPSLVDVKYDRWSKTRLDRLLVDYLLRMGYTDSAEQLAQEKGIRDLVDVEAFVAAADIETSLRKRRTHECLAWCSENKRALKEIHVSLQGGVGRSLGDCTYADPQQSNLELELRLQHFIEMTRNPDMAQVTEAMLYARRYLGVDQEPEIGLRAGGLLIHGSTTECEPYRV